MTDPSWPTWVALIRGINVGTHKRMPMAGLRSLLAGMGYGEVRTYVQSGNAIFTAPGDDPRRLEADIAAGIQADVGFDVTVLVRSAAELSAVVDGNPFVGHGADPKQLHVAFLSSDPPADAVTGLDHRAYDPDEFRFGDRAIYLRLQNGIQGSRLPDWERTLGVAATSRNWNTVTRLRALSAS